MAHNAPVIAEARALGKKMAETLKKG